MFVFPSALFVVLYSDNDNDNDNERCKVQVGESFLFFLVVSCSLLVLDMVSRLTFVPAVVGYHRFSLFIVPAQ